MVRKITFCIVGIPYFNTIINWHDAVFSSIWSRGNEKRLKALDSMQIYQKRIARAFNKRVKCRNIKIGDLVLKEMGTAVHDPRGKFMPNWLGPFIVKSITPQGMVQLMDMDGTEFATLVNLDRLKRYFA